MTNLELFKVIIIKQLKCVYSFKDDMNVYTHDE